MMFKVLDSLVEQIVYYFVECIIWGEFKEWECIQEQKVIQIFNVSCGLVCEVLLIFECCYLVNILLCCGVQVFELFL